MPNQDKQAEWQWQWENYPEVDDWLFEDWIAPVKLEDFRGKRVLDAGCGGGHYLSKVAPYAREAVGVDLNASETARHRLLNQSHVMIVDGDIARVEFTEPFDIVYSVGVVHHTDDPDVTFANLAKLTKSGGKTVVWVYSHEGNFLNRALVEGAKKLFILRLSKPCLRVLSNILTVLLYPPVYTFYLLPLRLLPYYEYFRNFRRLSFRMNALNVFDKLNAPQTFFITRERIARWFSDHGYSDVEIHPYRGVSWHGSGTKNL